MKNSYLENTVKLYNRQITLNIKIYIGKGDDSYMIEAKTYTKNGCVIKFDPNYELSHEDYEGAYYCNTQAELETILNYIIGNPDIFADSLEGSEDVLDQDDLCIRY